ncbi:hypothetical protein [Sulfitobacter sp. BSw21498]|uniref:hypothetical protein n=1 Tax=Sulfitobacter sp. BSw21498 TaxID=664426 RepID=UPI001110E362|nr:hypothetical protein [Sulfitobacter sp. BSw21498]
MKKMIALAMFFLGVSLNSVNAQSLIKPGTCELIISSKKTYDLARQYVRSTPNNKNAKIFKTQNGWYAVSIGSLKPHQEDKIITEWKKNRRIPQDSFCSTGEKFVTEYNWKTGKTVPAKHTSVSTKSPKRSNSNSDRSFVNAGLCRMIYNQGKSPNGLLEPVQQQMEKRGRWEYEIGVYKLKNGEYAAAETMFKLPKYPKYYPELNREKLRKVSSDRTGGRLLPTARCTDGTDIASDTGMRLKKVGKKGSHLFVKALNAGAKTLRDSSSVKISREDAKRSELQRCHDYYVAEKFGFKNTHKYCVIEYCNSNNGSWYCKAEPKR